MTGTCTITDIAKLKGFKHTSSVYSLIKHKKLPPPLNPDDLIKDYVWDWAAITNCQQHLPIQQERKYPEQDGAIGTEIRDLLRKAKLPVKVLYTWLEISEAAFYDLMKGNSKLQPKTAEKLVTFLTLFKMNKKAYTAEILIQRFQEQYEVRCSKGDWLKNVDFALKQVGATKGALSKNLGYAGQSVITKLRYGRLPFRPDKKKLFLEFFSSRGWDYEKNQWIEKPAPVKIAPDKETAKPKQKLFTPDEQELIQAALVEFYDKIDKGAREARARGQILEAIKQETFRDRMDGLINKIDKWFEQ